MLDHPFSTALENVVSSFGKVLDVIAEHPDGQEGEDSDSRALYDLSNQFERPHEFLQTLLDMVRVFFEPDPPGTFFLNANPCYLHDALPDGPIRLGYASLLSEPSQTLSDMVRHKIHPQLAKLGYHEESYSTAFFAICRGIGQGGKIQFLTDKLLFEAIEVLNAGVTVDEAWGDLKASVQGESQKPPKKNCVGLSFDESLGDRLRVSVWLIMPLCQT